MHYQQQGEFRKKIKSVHTKNQSVQSRLIEKGMALVRQHHTEEEEEAILQELIQKEVNYTIPYFLKEKYDVKENTYAGMLAYELGNKEATSTPHILYLHGGAYVHQPNYFHWRFVHQITEEMPLTITLPIYPKAPHYTYVQSYAKVLLLYRKLVSEVGAENIILMGDSAGGGFALGFAQYLLEKELPQPAQIILISPWLDITLSNPEIEAYKDLDPMLSVEALRVDGKYYAGEMDPNEYMLSPINGQFKGLAPLTLFVGTHEIFLPDARKLKDKLESLAIDFHYFEYAHMNHIFTTYPIPEAKEAITQIIAIIKQDFKKFEENND